MEKSLEEKKRCIENADKIVFKLSSEVICGEALIKLIRQIEPCHYEEVVEERFVSKLCGYPSCPNELKNIPNKKYQILSDKNKIYELSDRKRYCSEKCYKASKYLEAQISTVPVWLRNTDEFKKTESFITLWEQRPKEQVKKQDQISNEKIEVEKLEIEKELKQIEKKWESDIKISNRIAPMSNIESHQAKKSSESTLSDEQIKVNEELRRKAEHLRYKFIQSMEIHKKPTELTILREIFDFKTQTEGSTKEKDEEETLLSDKRITFPLDPVGTNQLLLIEYICQRLRELLSARTKAYIAEIECENELKLNDERERQEIIEKSENFVIKKTATLFDGISALPNKNEIIAKPKVSNEENDNGEEEMKAKLKEFEDLFKGQNLTNDGDCGAVKVKYEDKTNNNKNDLIGARQSSIPDFEQLKKQSIEQQLIVREFYTANGLVFGGKKKNVTIEKANDETQVTIIDENNIDDTNEFDQNLVFRIKETNEEIVRILPTVDSKSQNKIRRNIFYEKLIKCMELLLKFSNFSYSAISNNLKNHVKNVVYSLK